MLFPHLVEQEIYRARQLFPGQEETGSLDRWIATITEELGECAREANEIALSGGHMATTDRSQRLHHLQTELVQTAAMCGRMYHFIDRLKP